MVVPGYSIEQLLAVVAEPKAVQSDISWELFGRRRKLEVAARSESLDVELRITGNFNGSRWSFSLMLEDRQILRWCTTRGHTNPDGVEIVGPHLHTLDLTHGDLRAHQPPGFVSTNVNDDFLVNDDFMAFLAECNVGLGGTYEAIPL